MSDDDLENDDLEVGDDDEKRPPTMWRKTMAVMFLPRPPKARPRLPSR